MEPLLVHPTPPPTDLARLLDLGGLSWKPVANEREATTGAPDGGWGGAIVVIGENSESAWALCRAIRKGAIPVEPLLVLIGGNRLDELEHRDDLYDDFCLDPFHPRELEARLRHLFSR
ncbi:MAG: response regulator transcription factor, partial [Acidimicrobiales bacterium]|nr:response regulator transcription factor [Acidimicrobiales bacterium]